MIVASAARRWIGSAHWMLARADAAGVRQLAALLGVRCRQSADGEHHHTGKLILLDKDGRMKDARH